MTSNQNQFSLPPKENSLFKRIIRCYEQKQYRQGLKFCKQILSQKAYKDHGETLAMKGLLLNNLGKKEEAMNCVKEGIKSALKSSICWHVYGLLLKSEKKYTEAIKCYQRALTFESDNLQILRDLSLNQIHIRDYSGYKNTRFQLLKFKPSQRISWLGYIVGLHLVGNHQQAVEVIREFLSTQDNVEKYSYEHSEILLYNAEILWEGGKFEELASFLETNEKAIVDKKSLKEMQGQVYEKLGRTNEALNIYENLLQRNPENRAYYENLERINNFQTVQDRVHFYDQVVQKNPRATLPQRLPLEFLEGEEFFRRADEFIRKGLQKCIPTLFVQLRPLYSAKHRRDTLEKLFVDHYSSLCAAAQNSHGDNACSTASRICYDDLEPPSTKTWSAYLLVQHYSFVGNTAEALKIALEELRLTPTLIEWYTLIASIYKQAGDPLLGSEWMVEAQSLDTADRYINSQCVQYLIDANRLSETAEMAAKFTREGTSSLEYLDEMQCMWFLISTARMHKRLGEWGDALKRCHEIDRHFTTMTEDQLDFHIYCLRKGTLRAYVKMLKMEDALQSHSYYFEAASIAIEIYLQLHDQPMKEASNDNDLDTSNLSKEELKKMRLKQRKERRKAEQEAAKARAEQEKREAAALRARGGGNTAENNADNDKLNSEQEKLDPVKLAKTEKPLEEVQKFLQPLLNLADGRIETHCYAYEVAERKNQVLLMLRAVVHGARISNCLSNAHYHQCLCRFLLRWRTLLDERRSNVAVTDTPQQEQWNQVLQLMTTTLANLTFAGANKAELPSLDKTNVTQWNDRFLQKYGFDCLDNLTAVYKVRYAIDPSQGVKLARELFQVDLSAFKSLSHEDGDKLLRLLLNPSATTSFGCNNPAWTVKDIEPLRVRLAARFPFARAFFTQKQLEETLKLDVICPTSSALRPKLPEVVSKSNTGCNGQPS